MKIDFVITWVDMEDPAWQRDFAHHSGKTVNEKNAVSVARFRDYGFLKYWFRGVEKFAPWVNKIHFVTCGQKPEWLDASHPKLNLVDHKDYIPQQFLPCYNSVVIERYLHKIPDIAEHFVYFNDDFFIINSVEEERFFQNGLPCDIAAFQYNPSWSQWYKRIKNNITIINAHFDKKEVMSRWHEKWFAPSYGSKARMNYMLKPYRKFITLRTPHNAQPFLKSTFEEVWAAAEKELTETSANRFRAVSDYTPELFRTWQICSGNFTPYNTYADTKMFPLMIRPKQAVRAIQNQSYKLVCINDHVRIRNYAQVMENIKNAFESILPEKSTFEIAEKLAKNSPKVK
ncbi:MAG: Stealth CR1 domain-containing protein [Bacteroidales bacterium]|nr:Stealth CR1 domain-containing protein [Bacteroidales bacterium]